MPTGYTDQIYKGISFEDFVLSCSRNFGALIHMRDESMSAEITLPVESDYHKEALASALLEMETLKKMAPMEAAKRAQEEFNNTVQYRKELDAEREAKRAQLNAMLVKVKAWVPPTTEHCGLGEFMIKQIEETIRFDCDGYEEEEPQLKTPEEWLESRISNVQWDIDYHTKQIEESKARNESRRKWITALFESVGRGDQVEKLKNVKF